MCDPAYCARLDSGPPLVAIEALEALARTLELMRHADVAPSFGTVIPEEDTHAPPTPTPPAAALPGTGRQPEPSPGSAIDTGNSGGSGGPAADGGTAAQGGLQTDDIVLTLNGQPVRTNNLRALLSRIGAGEEVAVGLIRDGERRSLTVTLGERQRRQR